MRSHQSDRRNGRFVSISTPSKRQLLETRDKAIAVETSAAIISRRAERERLGFEEATLVRAPMEVPKADMVLDAPI